MEGGCNMSVDGL